MDLDAEKQKKLKKLVNLVNRSEISSIKSIVSGVVRIINDPKSSIWDLKEMVEIDPPLTAKVLRVANSVYYSPPQKIGEIKQALIWIGFDTLKEMALSQKVAGIFNENDSINGHSIHSLWKHSVAVALLTKMIYRREFRKRGANAYVAGLLHDIGIIVESQFLQNDFSLVLSKAKHEKKNLSEAEQEVLGLHHADIGMAIAENWNLPQELVTAIGYHDSPLEAEQEFSKLASTLYIAEDCSQNSSIGYSEAPFRNNEVFDKCLTELNIDPHALDLIVADAKRELNEMEEQGLF
ncbi:MAG: HDOD domain-containing protein [Candidatus Desulfatibia sp.]|uniref:HDOD domain-containing protein n=1 Tax=Candidatus Desulfatibia sp. TaxID=3101189 RepID=UPI002F32631C